MTMSRLVSGSESDHHSDSSMLPEDMANQSVRLKEEQLRREEEKLREIELKVQREIQIKRQELMAKEDSLKVLEARLGTLLLVNIVPCGKYADCARRSRMILITFKTECNDYNDNLTPPSPEYQKPVIR